MEYFEYTVVRIAAGAGLGKNLIAINLPGHHATGRYQQVLYHAPRYTYLSTKFSNKFSTFDTIMLPVNSFTATVHIDERV
jgi:hypothetical protein